MIPKIIHYCWFGGKPLPESVKFNIESWKRNLPDFEIREWNESNFDINSHPFVRECYKVKKFGFIVDVLRNHVLKEHGGIYLDTDVQFIKPIPDELLENSSIICYEDSNFPNVGFVASEKGGQLVSDIYKLYENKHFLNQDGSFNDRYTGPKGYADIIESHGIKLDGSSKENYDGGLILTQDYFCAKSWRTGIIDITQNTCAIHLYEASWFSEEQKRKATSKKYIYRLNDDISVLKELLSNEVIFNMCLNAMSIKFYKPSLFSIKRLVNTVTKRIKK